MQMIARFLARPAVVDWLIARAARTPYLHIADPVTGKIYMERYWLFNPYLPAEEKERLALAGQQPTLWWRIKARFPSVRLHRIMRPDGDRHMHDHPWDARTFILRGWYNEVRRFDDPVMQARAEKFGAEGAYYCRLPGDTVVLRFGEYHRIMDVSSNGVWTLFLTWPYKGTWGFLVDGKKVSYKEYLQ